MVDKYNDRESTKVNQLMRYLETILSGAAEKGAHAIKFVPEGKDIVVYFIHPNNASERVLAIPRKPSFGELWQLALAPVFERTGQHVMKVGAKSFLYRIKGMIGLSGGDIRIDVKELEERQVYPFNDDGGSFRDEPWEKVGSILDSIINLGLDRNSDRIEMHPGDPDVEIIYFTRGQGLRRLTISKQTFNQMVHYMRDYYFVFGFAVKRFGVKDYIVKPKALGRGDDPLVVLVIEPIQGEIEEDTIDPDEDEEYGGPEEDRGIN